MTTVDAGNLRPESRARFSYQNSSAVAGRPLGELLYIPLLAIALGADVAAFYQVVSLVMPDAHDQMIMLLVAGLTATAVMLAHFAGHFARDLLAEHGAATKLGLWICLIAWALLGLAAVVVRAAVAGDSSDGLDVTAVDTGGGATDQYVAALLFGALYFASGMVAAIGAFVTRNPLRTAFRKAHRRFRKTTLKLRKSEPPFERAKHAFELHRTALRRDEDNYRAAWEQRLAFGEELKRYSAVLIAAHLQSPSATDGMTEPDWRRRLPDRPPAADDDGPEPVPGGKGPSTVPPQMPPTSTLSLESGHNARSHANGS